MSWLDNIVINLGLVQGSTMDLVGLGLDQFVLKKKYEEKLSSSYEKSKLIHDLVDLKLILSKSSPWFIDF